MLTVEGVVTGAIRSPILSNWETSQLSAVRAGVVFIERFREQGNNVVQNRSCPCFFATFPALRGIA